MMPEGRWLPDSLTPEYRPDDQPAERRPAPTPASLAPDYLALWSMGIDTEQAIILCWCGQWWQGDPEDAATGGPGSCRRPGHRILAVITTWEEA